MQAARKRLAFLLAALMLLCGCRPAPPAVNEPQETVPTADVPAAREAEAADTDASEAEPQEEPGDIDLPQSEPTEEPVLRLKINDTAIPVLWEDNESVDALAALVREAPLTIPMSPYGGFEQVGPIGSSLPRSDAQTTTQPGDLVLYSGDQIVVFYGSNTWAYTRLGRIEDRSVAELTELLGNGGVTLTLSWE